VRDVSVYGTPAGFRGHANPGDSFLADAAVEYSATRNWVLALDVAYEHDASPHVAGNDGQSGSNPQSFNYFQSSGSTESVFLAPAIEYNWSGKVGVIAGARILAAGRNTTATITPVAAINYVF
jgi:hypothetical protein